jgi:hypothetical protein
MKLKTMFRKYPLTEAVMNNIIELKSNGVRYSVLKNIWERRVYELYPNDWKKLKFPSRQTLWKLEKDYWFTTCPMCGQRVHKSETIETFMTEPQPHWDKVCKECYLQRKWEYYRTKGHSPFIEDYVFVKRGHGTRYTDPRRDEQ